MKKIELGEKIEVGWNYYLKEVIGQNIEFLCKISTELI
jgi:hypothetical protein